MSRSVDEKFGLQGRRKSKRNPYSVAAVVMACVCFGLGLALTVAVLILGIVHKSASEAIGCIGVLLAAAAGGTLLLILSELIQLLDRIAANTNKGNDT